MLGLNTGRRYTLTIFFQNLFLSHHNNIVITKANYLCLLLNHAEIMTQFELQDNSSRKTILEMGGDNYPLFIIQISTIYPIYEASSRLQEQYGYRIPDFRNTGVCPIPTTAEQLALEVVMSVRPDISKPTFSPNRRITYKYL